MSLKYTGATKLNDSSVRINRKYVNGYTPNMRHTLSHRPVMGTKSVGFVHKKHGMKYGTTKSLPIQRNSRQSSWKSAVTTGTSGHSSGGHHHEHGRGKTIHRAHGPSGFHRSLQEKKEKSIAFFDIELQKSESYIHRPGEEVTGSIHMDVVKNVEIRFLDLLIVGQGTVTIRHNKQGLPKTQKEVYLHKSKCVIGTSDARWSSVLTPGHYVSNFKVKLPKDIPSSLSYKDPVNGVSFDIGYVIKARLCDDVGSSSLRSIVSTNNAVKVLLSKKQTINVQRAFDIHLIPNAMNPVAHEESVVLSCGNNSVANFTLGMDRAVFLAGDDIRLQLSSQIPASQSIKDMTCTLKQHIILKEIGEKRSITISDISRRQPNDDVTQNGQSTTISLDVTIPTQTHLLSSFLTGCKTSKVAYTLDVVIRLQPAGGKVTFTIPIEMGPCAEPIYAEKTTSRKFVPIFNRPVRFPCFSPTQQKTSNPEETNQSKSLRNINVVTSYSNSAMSRCFLCCFVGSSTMD